MQKLRVLVVQSEWFSAARLKAEIESLGHQVVAVARDGREAIVLAREAWPDLVFMDIRLPVADGIEVTRTILRRRPLPIVLLTGYLSEGLVRRARAAGVMAYIVTPAHRRQLRSAIEVALARFREFQILHAEAGDLQEALETRVAVEHAKHVLMRWLKLSEPEAFNYLAEQNRSTGRGFKKIAWTIEKADELLLRQLKLTECLQRILHALSQVEVVPTKAA